jgi:hypothetical protein
MLYEIESESSLKAKLKNYVTRFVPQSSANGKTVKKDKDIKVQKYARTYTLNPRRHEDFLALKEILLNPEEEYALRIIAMNKIAKVHKKDTIKLLEEVILQGDEFMRVNALCILARSPYPEASTTLIKFIKSDCENLVVSTINMLGSWGGSFYIPMLNQLKEETKSEKVKMACKNAIEKIMKRTLYKTLKIKKTEN